MHCIRRIKSDTNQRFIRQRDDGKIRDWLHIQYTSVNGYNYRK